MIFEGIVPLGIGHRPAIEPHIDEVEFACHGFAGGAHQGNAIHVGAVQILGEVFCRLVEAKDLVGFFDFLVEFIDAADADFFGTVFCAPDGQGRSPESGAGEVPIYEVFEPVAESAFAGGSGFPVDGFVEFYQAIFYGCGAHEPALEGVVEDGFIGTPAVGVGVLVFFNLEGFVFLFEFDGDALIHAEVFITPLLLGFCGFFFFGEVGFFNVFAGEVGYAIKEFPFFIYQCEGADAIFAGCFKIVGTEAWCDVHDTGTILGGYEVAYDHSEGVAFFGLGIGEELVVAGSFQGGAFLGMKFSPGEDFLLWGIIFQGGFSAFGAEILTYQGRGQGDFDFCTGVGVESLNLVVVDVFSYRQGRVAGQCPRGGCPCEKILILRTLHLKLGHDGGVFHVLVGAGLVEFMAR